jgi:hypothetical protein
MKYEGGNLMAKQKKPSHLKLVVVNPPPIQKKSFSQTRDPNTGFAAEIRKTGDARRYILMACDPFHFLDCEIGLEIHDDEDEGLEPRTVTCHFPNILDEDLNEFVEEDETLYAMILMLFQLKVLEQILLFCSDHDASSLLINTDSTSEGHALEIYRDLTIYEDKIPTLMGTRAQLVIPTALETFDKLLDLMDNVNQDFRKTLWENQSTNPAIREYLKFNPFLKFFG